MLLFMDGAAHYDSSRVGLKYSAMSANKTTWSVTSEGRFGNCIKRVAVDNFSSGYLDIAPLTTRSGVWTPSNSGVCGFAFKVDDLTRLGDPNENGGSDGLFCIMESGHFYLKITINNSGTFSLVQAWGPLDGYGAAMAVSTEGISAGAWSYLEFKWLLDNSAGSFEMRVNTIPVLTYTGDTTAHDPTWDHHNLWNAVRILGLPSQPTSGGLPGLTTRSCDLYLADLRLPDADDVHDFLGDGTIQTIIPNGVGSTTGWTPSGTNNWDMVNDRPAPDDDGTYNAATFVGTQDTYNFEDIPPLAEVKGVQMCILARKETEGSATLAPVVHQGSTDYVGPAQGVASIVYDRYLTQPYDINPATSAPWTPAEVNAGQFGVKKIL